MSVATTNHTIETHAVNQANWGRTLANFVLPQRSENFVLASIMLDICFALLGLTLADAVFAYQFSEMMTLPQLLAVFVLVGLVWCVTFFSLALYNPDKTYTLRREITRVSIGVTLAQFVLSGILAVTITQLPSQMLLLMYALVAFSMTTWRVIAHTGSMLSVLSGTAQRQRILIIGTNDDGEALARLAERHPSLNKQVVGFVDNHTKGKFAGFPVLSSLNGNLFKLIRHEEIDEIVVAVPSSTFHANFPLMKALRYSPVPVYILPQHINLDVKDMGGATWNDIPFVCLFPNTVGSYTRLAKRAFDVCVASLALIAALPVMSVVALLIVLDSKGGVFFLQDRMGQHGHRFKIFKFRSMVANADQMIDQVKQVEDDGTITYKHRGDMRVTDIGHFIRKTSLDELPQLLNVLRGDMSLVGPRPETLKIVDSEYEAWQYQRLRVPQGITGWWQVNGRAERECYQATEEDLYYVNNCTFWLDIKILLMTIPAVLRGRGAI